MLTPTPAIVRVHYRGENDEPRTFTGAMCEDQHDGVIGLVANEAAWRDPHVCRWQVRFDRITRVEVVRPAYEPTVMAQLLAGLDITPRERLVYEVIVEAGGRLQFRDVASSVIDDAGHRLEPWQVSDAIQALVATGHLSITHSTDASSGIVTVN